MAISKPRYVILSLPGVLRNIAWLGTGQSADIGGTTALHRQSRAHDVLLHVDCREFLVLDDIGDAGWKSKGRDVKTRAGGGAVVLNSCVAYAQFAQ